MTDLQYTYLSHDEAQAAIDDGTAERFFGPLIQEALDELDPEIAKHWASKSYNFTIRGIGGVGVWRPQDRKLAVAFETTDGGRRTVRFLKRRDGTVNVDNLKSAVKEHCARAARIERDTATRDANKELIRVLPDDVQKCLTPSATPGKARFWFRDGYFVKVAIDGLHIHKAQELLDVLVAAEAEVERIFKS